MVDLAKCRWGGCVGRALVLVLLTTCLVRVAAAAPEPKGKAISAEVTQGLTTINETQRGVATTLGELRDQIDSLRRSVSDIREDLRRSDEIVQAISEQTKGMREEVRGLYVESSGLKGDIAAVGKDIEALRADLASFRTSAGLIIGLVIVLQVVLFFMMLRNRR